MPLGRPKLPASPGCAGRCAPRSPGTRPTARRGGKPRTCARWGSAWGALLIEKQARSPDAVTDMGLRAALAAALAAELHVLTADER